MDLRLGLLLERQVARKARENPDAVADRFADRELHRKRRAVFAASGNPPLAADNVPLTGLAILRQPAVGNGENTRQAYADKGLADFSPLRIKASTHAVLYALDAETGKELFSSGDQIKSFNHFSGLSVANGRVYIATFDGILYCFGLPGSK